MHSARDAGHSITSASSTAAWHTQIHRYTNTQIRKYTDTQIQRYKKCNCGLKWISIQGIICMQDALSTWCRTLNNKCTLRMYASSTAAWHWIALACLYNNNTNNNNNDDSRHINNNHNNNNINNNCTSACMRSTSTSAAWRWMSLHGHRASTRLRISEFLFLVQKKWCYEDILITSLLLY